MSVKSRILIVEDNDFVRMQIVRFLEEANFDVTEASNGNTALEKVRDNIDVAIVDIRMEPIDGFEFIRTLRAEGMDTSVILVTGDHNPDLLSEASKWGVEAVLMKPVQRDRLVKAVTRTIETQKRAP